MTPDLADVPPHDADLEKTVLQTLISCQTNQPLFLAHLAAEHFYDDRHRGLFALAGRIHDRDGSLDLPMVTTALADDGLTGALAQQCGGLAYVWCEVMHERYSGSPYHARTYVRRLRELARARRHRQIGQRLAAGVIDEEERAHLVDELAEPVWAGECEDTSTAMAVAQRAAAEYDAAVALATSGRRFRGLDSGFDPLNAHLNGLCPGELTVLAGRPAIGKSTLALQIGLHVARREQASVGFISLEMTPAQIGSRLGALMAGVDPHRQRRGLLPEPEARAYLETLAELSRLPIQVFTADRTIGAIRGRMGQHPDVTLWIVDHLHRVAGGQGDNEHERLGSIAHVLADLAVTCDRHVLLLSQLNRACEERQDKIPQLADLRGSGSIEEHAVNVLMIARPGHYAEIRARYPEGPQLHELLHTAVLYAEKCRFEAPGPIELRWLPERACFANPVADRPLYETTERCHASAN